MSVMTMMSKVGRVFTKRRRTPGAPTVVKWPPEEGEPSLREVASTMSPPSPIAIDVEDDEEEKERQRTPSRQELIAELQKSYSEVISMVRKLDDHLDRHESRSTKMMEVADRLTDAMDGIERTEDRHVEIVGAIGALAKAVREGQDRADHRHEAELSSLARIEAVLEKCDATDQATRMTLDELRAGIASMGSSQDRLGSVLERMHDRDEARDERLEEMVTRTSKLMIALVSICGVGVAAAILVATIVAVKL